MNSAIFMKLFEQSTSKKTSVVEPKPRPETQSSQLVISAKSMKIALKKEIGCVTQVIGDRDISTREELIEILKELSIIDSTISSAEEAMLLRGIDRCRTVDGSYSAKILERKLIESLTQTRCRRFNVLVANRFRIARANEKLAVETQESKAEVNDVASVTSKMQKETLDRLLTVRTIVDATPEDDTAFTGLSEGSKRVLRKSRRTQDLQMMSLEKRNEIMTKMKQEAIQKLEKELQDEELREMQTPNNLGAMPEFYHKLHLEKKPRIDEEKEEESHRPKTTKYEDYQKQKSRQSLTPVGWENTVQRMRLARIERNQIQEALDPRSGPVKISARVSYADWKKKMKEQKPQAEIAEAETGALEEVDLVLGL
jgi:hypothetical protein